MVNISKYIIRSLLGERVWGWMDEKKEFPQEGFLSD